MKPIKFKGQNIIIGENRPDDEQLPAFITPTGEVVSWWEPSFWERVKILFGQNVCLVQATQNSPMQEIFLTTIDPIRYTLYDPSFTSK